MTVPLASGLARRKPRHRILASPALALAAILLTGAGSVALAADAAVSIANFAYQPSSVTVNVGDSVTWTNNDSAPHTATANDESFDTGTIGNGGSDSVTFTTAGTFAYHCSIHPQMSGVVVVQGAAATPGPTPRPTAPGTSTAVPSSEGSSDAGIMAILAAAGVAFGVAAVRMGRPARR
jgi:plastocyanin